MLTEHSILRVKERAGIKSRRRAETFLEKAMERGKTGTAFSSLERSYLQNIGKNDCSAIAYNGYCLIVGSNRACVTVYELPAWFGRKKRYHGKKRIRNAKKYWRYHCAN